MNYKELSEKKIEKSSNSLNSLSPYIGRLRPECASFLIGKYANVNTPIFDPFCGSGTVLLEGWRAGYDVYGNDLSPYAHILSLGKTNPYPDVNTALAQLQGHRESARRQLRGIDLNYVPEWVRAFYNDDTLKEIIAWVHVLKKRKDWFLLSCLLGILHHQRPGFLSYPASHGAPYLRSNSFPQEEYPEMYAYKNVYEKLSLKIERVYKHFPSLDYSLSRTVFNKNAASMRMSGIPNCTIITSPPYMRSLTYARDNRLRLWFLGEQNYDALDNRISPKQSDFKKMMNTCFMKWSRIQEPGERCVVVIGDIQVRDGDEKISLAQYLEQVSKKNYEFLEAYTDPIPESRKLVKGHNSIKREIIAVFKRR